jgi:hypothetical protein
MARGDHDDTDWWGPAAGPLPTPSSVLRARCIRVVLTCRACHHQQDADLQALVDAGRGDVPLIRLRWRCGQCGHRQIDIALTTKPTVGRPR